MTLHENARFTAYRLVNEYIENIDTIYLWDLARIIKNAFLINAITKEEVTMLGYNASRLTFDEIMNS